MTLSAPAGIALYSGIIVIGAIAGALVPIITGSGKRLVAFLALTAFLGLALHTLFDGVALASASATGVGFMAFIAIAAHKVPSSLSLAAIYKSEGKPNRAILGYAALYGLMVPAGAAAYWLLARLVHLDTFAPRALA